MVPGPCSPASPVSGLSSNWDSKPGTLGQFLPFLHPDTYPCTSSPWSYSIPAAGLEGDLLQHWNALQSSPPSLEIFGVRGRKSQ